MIGQELALSNSEMIVNWQSPHAASPTHVLKVWYLIPRYTATVISMFLLSAGTMLRML